MPHPPPPTITPRLIDLVSRNSEALRRWEGAVAEVISDSVSDPVSRLLSVFQTDESLSIRMLMERLRLKHRTHFRRTFLNPALDEGKIAMSEPDSPHSPKQRYRLT